MPSPALSPPLPRTGRGGWGVRAFLRRQCMSQFIARRLVSTAPLLVLISIIAFSLILLLPGDPALAILGEERANANNRQAYYALRQELGLDDPIPIQYFH